MEGNALTDSRFRVVKVNLALTLSLRVLIECISICLLQVISSHPYTRGRWVCFDYDQSQQNTINIARSVPANNSQPNPEDDPNLCSDHNAVAGANNDQSEVAIDDKIEKAMDLVKSHLMFAVREEVDVLKERIKELESDIQILKSHATPETLALLSNRSTTTPSAE